MLSKFHSTHARTLHACAVEEPRFVTERKKKKTKPNLNLGRYLRKVRVKRTAKISGTAIKSHHNQLLEGSGDTAKTYNIQNKQPKAKLLWLKEEFVTQTNYHNFDLSVDLTSGRSAKRQKYVISCRRTIIYDLQLLKKIKQLWYDATMCFCLSLCVKCCQWSHKSNNEDIK